MPEAADLSKANFGAKVAEAAGKKKGGRGKLHAVPPKKKSGEGGDPAPNPNDGMLGLRLPKAIIHGMKVAAVTKNLSLAGYVRMLYERDTAGKG